jgi:tRNA-(ms[2]io[6]A)-hydroxylase
MQYYIDLTYDTPIEWAQNAIKDLPAFLRDHADCERKASAMAMSFVAKAHDKKEIIPELIDTAIEELEHFQSVYKIMEDKGVLLTHNIEKDTYIEDLIKLSRTKPEDRLIDRLLLASIIETRGAERFRLISEAIEDPELKKFYKDIWISEANHGNIFVRMALNYRPKDEIYKRLHELNDAEGEICKKLPWRHAVH